MTRRAIRRDEEASIRARVAEAIEASSVEVVGFYWNRLGSLRSIAVRSGPESERDITQHEIAALAAVGIHPGADGWEIEEAPANARPPLPPGSGWFTRGIDSYSLDGPNGKPIAKAHHDGRSWTWSILSTFVRTTARDLREAQERAEDACRAAGLFDAPTAEPLLARVARILGMDPQCVRVTWEGPFSGTAARITRVEASGMEISRAGYDLLVADGLTVVAAPDLGTKVDALHDAAGAPPTGAALALYRLLCADAGEDEHGHHSDEAIGSTCAARAARRARLCEAFVAELSAAPPMPAPRTTDGALTAHLLEHHREAWRPGEDALALAIRLLDAGRETGAEIGRLAGALEEAQEEAKISDANAAELAKTAATLRRERNEARAALAREEARRIEAERGRGEALGDLATVRADVLKSAHDLAAKMGAPHG